MTLNWGKGLPGMTTRTLLSEVSTMALSRDYSIEVDAKGKKKLVFLRNGEGSGGDAQHRAPAIRRCSAVTRCDPDKNKVGDYPLGKVVGSLHNCSATKRWESLVDPKDGHKKVFCVLQAYFDESGTHGGSDVCVLAGYFGGVRQWSRFETNWLKVLEGNGVEKFHAKRFWARDPNGHRVGKYKNWSDDQAETFIRDLLAVIQAHRIFPIGSAVLMRDWLALPEHEKRYLTGGEYDYQRRRFITSGAPSRTYFLPFLFAIQKVCDHCKVGLKVHFSFERNDSYCRYALDYFKAIGEIDLPCSSKMGNILFPSSIEAPPVQAADLLAYQTYQYGRQRWGQGKEIEMPPIVLELLQRIRSRDNDFKLFDKESFDITLRKFRSSFPTPDPQGARNQG